MSLIRKLSVLLKGIRTQALPRDLALNPPGLLNPAGKRWFSDIPEEYGKYYRKATLEPKLHQGNAGRQGVGVDDVKQAAAASLPVESDQQLAAKAGGTFFKVGR